MIEKFEDTRQTMSKVIEIFNLKHVDHELRNIEFETEIRNLIYEKSVRNFELFSFVFDRIIEKGIDNSTEFKDKILNSNTKSASKFKELFLDETVYYQEKTVEIAFSIFRMQEQIIVRYLEYFGRFSNDVTQNSNSFNSEYIEMSSLKFSNKRFDVFLSHKYIHRLYNLIIFYIFTVYSDLNVYADWIFDFEKERKKLTEENVRLLKHRMSQSNRLVFFNISKSSTTNWMAWEVGYFSCLRKESIAILDLDDYCKGNTKVEVLSSNDIILFDVRRFLYLERNQCDFSSWAKST